MRAGSGLEAGAEHRRAGDRTAITCAMCGQRFDPDGLAACAGCPLNSSCSVACCPACGYSNADESRSTLARAYRRLTRS